MAIVLKDTVNIRAAKGKAHASRPVPSSQTPLWILSTAASYLPFRPRDRADLGLAGPFGDDFGSAIDLAYSHSPYSAANSPLVLSL